MEKQKIVVGGGCFWCLEACFRYITEMDEVTPGYMGGTLENPTYEQVCSGTTGHAEVVQVTFDPARISLEAVLTIFWSAHDPTQLNRQGNDIGTQYRSVVFYANKEQKESVEQHIDFLEENEAYPEMIVTELTPVQTFYPAEIEHHNYFEKHPEKAYCQHVIAPKVNRIKRIFGE